MKINKTLNGTALNLSLEGRLDTTTAPELESELSNSLKGVTELTIDLEHLDYISSAGLRVLLSTHKAMTKQQGSMKVIHVGEMVQEVFDVTGFSDILNIE